MSNRTLETIDAFIVTGGFWSAFYLVIHTAYTPEAMRVPVLGLAGLVLLLTFAWATRADARQARRQAAREASRFDGEGDRRLNDEL